MSVDLRARAGRVGVWLGPITDADAATEAEYAARLEEYGYGMLWYGETHVNREALTHAAGLLTATQRVLVGSGIANIWVRDATAAINGAHTLNEAHDDRFVLGLGVSHQPLVDTRGHDYGKPLTAMRGYLDAIDAANENDPSPRRDSPIVLAALRTKMLELARERTAGAHPYFVPPEHTARAREALGAEPFLAPEQAVLLETDPARARERGRAHTSRYLKLPNYVNNLKELGWADGDLDDGGSDALVDAIVAWGDEEAIAARVAAHHDAGADHVCVQALAESPADSMAALERLAPALLQR